MNKIIYGGILTILILAILSIFAVYSGLIPGVEIPNNKKEYWTFELYPGNNQINITQEQIDCGGSTPDEFFISISTEEIMPVVFYQDPTGGWDSWVWNDPWNPYQTMKPGIHTVNVQIECTLKILKC